MGISCNPILDPSVASSHWAGLTFYHSRAERVLTQENTLYVLRSMSQLMNVDIRQVVYVFELLLYVKVIYIAIKYLLWSGAAGQLSADTERGN